MLRSVCSEAVSATNSADRPDIFDAVTLSLGPRSSERPPDAGWTLVAGLEGVAPVLVDGGGLASPLGADWTLDWWVGADDRWHFPAREPAVRQRRIGHGPIVETSLRVPSGDVVHTAYPVVVPGGVATIIEITNDSPVPVALAMAIRPYSVDAARPVPQTNRRVDFGADDLVMIDGAPALQLPRRPNEAGGSVTEDLLDILTDGQTVNWPGPLDGPSANAALLYPLPHRTSLRFAILGPGVTQVNIEGLPDAASSARGWTAVVDNASRFQFPDSGVSDLAGAARARLLLAAPDLPAAVVDGAPGAGLILAGLAFGGYQLELRRALDAFAQSFPTSVTSAADGAWLVEGIGLAAETLGDAELNQHLLEPASQLTHLTERQVKKQRNDPTARDAAAQARLGLSRLVAAAGQTEAAAQLAAESPFEPVAADLDVVTALAEAASPSLCFAGPTDPDSTDPDSAVAAAEFWLAARELLLRSGTSTDQGLPLVELLPGFPTAWLGGTVETHRAPLAGARISFAIRWHGYRPALLWEVESTRPIALSCPGLDPQWTTTEAKGEALLAGVADELPTAPMPGDSFN